MWEENLSRYNGNFMSHELYDSHCEYKISPELSTKMNTHKLASTLNCDFMYSNNMHEKLVTLQSLVQYLNLTRASCTTGNIWATLDLMFCILCIRDIYTHL